LKIFPRAIIRTGRLEAYPAPTCAFGTVQANRIHARTGAMLIINNKEYAN
jgi:hypothetical protein